jgi:hypothetical protein
VAANCVQLDPHALVRRDQVSRHTGCARSRRAVLRVNAGAQIAVHDDTQVRAQLDHPGVPERAGSLAVVGPLDAGDCVRLCRHAGGLGGVLERCVDAGVLTVDDHELCAVSRGQAADYSLRKVGAAPFVVAEDKDTHVHIVAAYPRPG